MVAAARLVVLTPRRVALARPPTGSALIPAVRAVAVPPAQCREGRHTTCNDQVLPGWGTGSSLMPQPVAWTSTVHSRYAWMAHAEAAPGKRWPITVDRDGALLVPPSTAVARQPAVQRGATGSHAIGRAPRKPPAISLLLLLAANVTRPKAASRPIATSCAAWLPGAVVFVPSSA